MSEKIKRVMYISRARHKMTRGELVDLLAGARARNAANGITGLLIYEAGNFAQVLEGSVEAIDRLLANIASDPRHDDYALVSEGMADSRYFTRWSMDWAHLGLFEESRHTELRRHLREHNIADRAAVYRAILKFVQSLEADRDVADP